ncbi:MAG: DeoR family transcriptional regulator, partial [Christensenella hongkongensis]
MDQNNPYFMEERRKLIQSIIQKEKRVTISELSRRFDIGEATIRRDLNAMEKSGLIQKTHGGAILADR